MTDALGLVAASWGVMMALSPLLQMRRIFERRSSDDLSIGYLVVLQVGFALWIGYGWTRADWALLVPNAVALTVGIATVVVSLALRGHPPEEQG